MIPGSGPTDRDGNGPLGLKASTYKMLAEGLAERDIGSVRIDKRGMFGSAGAIEDPNDVTIRDYAQDVRSWVNVIREKVGATSIWVLGHSEGGLVALTAVQSGLDVQGLILVAAPGRPLARVLEEQLQQQLAGTPVLDQALEAISALEAGGEVDTRELHPSLQPLFNPAVQGFLRSTFALDPAAMIADIPMPILILQGQKDLQVGSDDAERLGKAAPRAKLVLLPDVNHVLKSIASDETGANLASYGNPSLPVDRRLVDTIAKFVHAHSGKRAKK